jgi:CHAD domain-containing protein
MDKTAKDDIFLFGADYILEQINQFEAEIDGALIGEDIEYVHRMRVASRRLRTALRLFNQHLPDNFGEEWRVAFKGITRALGNARDLDIQIELVELQILESLDKKILPGYQRLLLRLKQGRLKAQNKVELGINTIRENETLAEIRRTLGAAQINPVRDYSFDLYPFAYRAINSALDDFLSYQQAISLPNNGDKLHAMRIAGKHLRYTMEIFSPLYDQALLPFIDTMKNIQDQLGEIHDCDVWVSWLPEFINQERFRTLAYYGHTKPLGRLLPGVEHLIEDRVLTRQEVFETFAADWQRIITAQTWENLMKTIAPKQP